MLTRKKVSLNSIGLYSKYPCIGLYYELQIKISSAMESLGYLRQATVSKPQLSCLKYGDNADLP